MEFTGERFIIDKSKKQEDIYLEHLHRYLSIKKLCKDKIVLDIASGEGYGSKILSEVSQEITGIDICEDAIRESKLKYKADNLNYLVGDVKKIPIKSSSIDVVVSFETIEHVDEVSQMKFLKEVKRVLRKNGILIISTPDKKIYSDLFGYNNEFHVKEFYKEEFREFLRLEFNNIRFYYQNKEAYHIIKNENSCESETIELINPDFQKINEGKYIIGVCSNVECNIESINSFYVQESRDYLKSIERIIQLQDSERVLQNWAEKLLEENKEMKVSLETKQKKLLEISDWAKNLGEENKEMKVSLETKQKKLLEISDWARNLGEGNKEMKVDLETKQKKLMEISDWAKKLEEENKEMKISLKSK